MNAGWRETLGPERAVRVHRLLERIAAEADPFRPLVAGRLKALQAWQDQLGPRVLSEQPGTALPLGIGLTEACLILSDPSVHRAARAVKGARALAEALDRGERDKALSLAGPLEQDAEGLLDELRGRITELAVQIRECLELARAHRFAACHGRMGTIVADVAILTHVKMGRIPDTDLPNHDLGLPESCEALGRILFEDEDPEGALALARSAFVLSGALAHGTTGQAVRWIGRVRQARSTMASGETSLDAGLAALFVGHEDLVAALSMVATEPSRLVAPLLAGIRGQDWPDAAACARKLMVACGVLSLPLVERAASLGVVREALAEAVAEGDKDTVMALLEGV
ncbi:MAG: hypothetical protein VKO64_10390 [Candidatus Sericytochromatia bacterium]|nr:hypothetical protein [Candidatus Sericytochromatia bacterium]